MRDAESLLVVHGFPPFLPHPSPSPFCIKLETWLRIAGIEYRAVGDFDPFRAPKRKAPFVTMQDGTVLSDSSLIIESLTDTHAVTLDAELDAEMRAKALLLQRTVEDHLYFVFVYLRWQYPAGWETYRTRYFEVVFPALIRWIVPRMARRAALATLKAQGTGRHALEEVVAFGREDLDALATILGPHPFFLGDEPHGVDATVYGLLSLLDNTPFDDGLVVAYRKQPTLVAYVDRMRERFWS